MSRRELKKPKAAHGSRLGLGPEAQSKKRDFNKERPAFCLRFVESDWCITLCDKDDKAAFADRIRKLSSMTWDQILGADRHGFGREKISQQAIRATLPSHVTPDVTLVALRFSGLKPMVGYRIDDMFRIVWFDRDYSLYDHG